jgi:histidine triad (HIT) family protein
VNRAACVFCAIAAGDERGSIVHEDEAAFVLMDIAPVTPGHALVIPKRHADRLAQLDETTGGRLFALGMRAARALRSSGLRCDGVNLFLADGAAAGQDVFHVHLHVIPRFGGDGVRVSAGRSRPERTELDRIAALLRSAWDV